MIKIVELTENSLIIRSNNINRNRMKINKVVILVIVEIKLDILVVIKVIALT